MTPPDPTAERNLRLLQEIEANREFILMAYRSDPELLKRADPEIKRQFEPMTASAAGSAQLLSQVSSRLIAPE